jgi:hypothetical protein
MPIFHHDVTQYSEVYDRLRLGIPTSSHFHKIITPQGKPSKQWREYACILIAERILQRKIEFYNSLAMERGLIVEAEAADWYEFDQDVIVERVGFITDDNHTIGCSPDRLVGDEGLLEISRPPYRTFRSNTGFPERSMNASGLSCKVSSTFPSEAGSISYAGMTCFQRSSCGLSPMRSSSTPSTASCRYSTSLSTASWKRSAPQMRRKFHKGDWRCRRHYERVWKLPRNDEN